MDFSAKSLKGFVSDVGTVFTRAKQVLNRFVLILSIDYLFVSFGNSTPKKRSERLRRQSLKDSLRAWPTDLIKLNYGQKELWLKLNQYYSQTQVIQLRPVSK